MKTALATMTAVAALSVSAAYASTSAVAVTDLNLRAVPGPKAEILEVIPSNGEVTVEGCMEGSSWCKVSYNKQTGWAYGDYLSVNAGSEPVFLSAAPETVAVPVIKIEDTSGEAALGAGLVGAAAGALVAGPVGAAVGGLAAAGLGAASDPGPHVETYVREHPVDPVYLDGEVVLGAGVPDSVMLQNIPETELVYANVNGLPVLVEPGKRKIVYIVR